MITADTNERSLRKFGADLRWLLEQAGGVDPESLTVSIVVDSKRDQDRIADVFSRGFGKDMQRTSNPNQLILLGVKVAVVVKKEHA